MQTEPQQSGTPPAPAATDPTGRQSRRQGPSLLNAPPESLARRPDVRAALEQWPRFIIVGQTLGGTRFRPSDWAERLAGVMAQYRPRRSAINSRLLSYSPYVVPSQFGSFSCVIVDVRLGEIEPMALNFVVQFAVDNDLQIAPPDGVVASTSPAARQNDARRPSEPSTLASSQ